MKYRKGTFLTIPNKDVIQGLDPITQVLFFWICNYADEDGKCFPSRSRLAKDCGVCVKSIDRHIETLCEKKLLKKDNRYENKTQTSNLYQILLYGATQSRKGETESPEGSDTESPTPATQSRTELNPIFNSIQLSKAFALFWDKYPSKKAKSVAVRSWNKLSKEMTKELLIKIINELEHQKKSRQWLDGIIPHPSTWLNQRRWEDEETELLSNEEIEIWQR